MNEKICKSLSDVSREVGTWLQAQPFVGEESITDWLLYELSKRLPFVQYYKFSRHQEAKTTGADWEWWIVSNIYSIAFRIQAKRISSEKDNYKSIAYTNRYGLQIEKLIESSQKDNFLSFYSLYTTKNMNQKVRCRWKSDAGIGEGIFLAGAEDLYEEFVKTGRCKVDADELIALSNPLSCLFCCPMTINKNSQTVNGLYDYLRNYYPRTIERSNSFRENEPGLHEEVPSYIRSLLEAEQREIPDWWESEYSNQFKDINSLVLFDMRDNQN
jgi:hypothetical protein